MLLFMIYVSFVPQENLSSEVSPQCQLTDDEDEAISDLELSSGSKETFVLEVSTVEPAMSSHSYTPFPIAARHTVNKS